jgi:hypothetical protein
MKLNYTSENGDVKVNDFNFDSIFDMSSTQKSIYDVAARPIIDSVLDGFNGTIFAYG